MDNRLSQTGKSHAATSHASSPWVVRRKPAASPRMKLICFPYAGAGSLVYHAWPDEIAPDIDVCVVQLPGRENRLGEPAIEDLARLTDKVVDALAPHCTGEFAIFGHSFGALMAYEVTCALHRKGLPLPRVLFTSGRESPSSKSQFAPMGGLARDAFVKEVARRYGAIPRAVVEEPTLLDMLLPAFRADLNIIERYVYRASEPLPVPIHAFGGTDDLAVRRPELEAWQRETRATFKSTMFPGGHFFLNEVRAQVLRAIEVVLGSELHTG
jgi:medium-chain acyl-[acyl-carrier-protein] hydrolase